MKLLIIFALIACTYADFKTRTGDDLHKYRDLCKAELSIPDEAIEQFKKWQFTDDHSACYINCVFRNMELFTNEDGFNVDNLQAQLGEDAERSAIEGCIDNTITDNCQKAFKGFTCFKTNNLQLIRSSVN